MDSTTAFTTTGTAFVDLVRRIRPEQWEEPGLGSWDVRSLTGHTARAILTVETYLLAEDPGRVSIPDAVSYYSALAGTVATPADVARRGVEAGVWLGDRPAERIEEALARATALIAAAPRGRAVSIGGHSILLPEYLRTRVLELVVHGLDLARATGLAVSLPGPAVEATAALAGALAARSGRGEEFLLAVTGRSALPDGFSVV